VLDSERRQRLSLRYRLAAWPSTYARRYTRVFEFATV
jgi:hypothetical protein